MEENKHNRRFLSTFFTQRKQVGAVAPSSRFLVNSMCNKIDFQKEGQIYQIITKKGNLNNLQNQQ